MRWDCKSARTATRVAKYFSTTSRRFSIVLLQQTAHAFRACDSPKNRWRVIIDLGFGIRPIIQGLLRPICSHRLHDPAGIGVLARH
jgi:hypothetical protein